VTNAPPGASYHNWGLALDFCLIVDKDRNGTFETALWDIRGDYDGDLIDDWTEVVTIFKMAGWEWGGDWASFKDFPHLQKVFGYHWQGLMKRFGLLDMDGTDPRYVRL
jgi:peptidoglycan L-alanyl-D-glutamate endopeptidase CwlK